MAQGFRVTVEHPEKIYEACKHISEIPLGETELASPLERIAAGLTSDAETISLTTPITFAPAKAQLGFKPTASAPELIVPAAYLGSKGYRVVEQNGRHVVYTGEGEPAYQLLSMPSSPLAIKRGRPIGTVTVAFATDAKDAEAMVRPLGTLDDFVKDITDYAKFTEDVVNGIYAAAGVKAPETELKLRAPVLADEAPGGMFGNLSELLGGGMPGMGGGDKRLKQELREKMTVSKKPDVTFKDIGGCYKAKEALEPVLAYLNKPELFKKHGGQPPRGILFYGPPGTGKTLLAKAIAAETKVPFYQLNVSDITSKWYGESEKLAQAAFDILRESPKSILFMDELEAVAPPRQDSHEVSKRVVSLLLQRLSGLDERGDSFIIGATNLLDSIDEAILRAGRMDYLVPVDLPDEDARKQIYEIHVGQINKKAEQPQFGTLNFKELVNRSDKYSGADIAEVVRRAHNTRILEVCRGKEFSPVKTTDILREMEGYERIRNDKKACNFGFALGTRKKQQDEE